MEFSILGPLEVRDDAGCPVDIKGLRRKTLLLRLLVDANGVVASDRLADDLWQGSSPPAASQTLQSHVSHLRKLLGRNRIRTVGHGYTLAVAGSEVDTRCFANEVDEGRRSLQEHDAVGAARILDAALSRWRGIALEDVRDEPWAVPEVAQLEELRLVGTELLLDAWLESGEYDRVVTEATRQVRLHPLRERFWWQSMLALYRAGRQAEALRAFTEVRDLLVGELGVEPSAELVELEQAMLEQRPALLETAAPLPRPEPTPDALPTGVVTFLLTDVVGSTRMWEHAPASMADALERHDEIVRRSIRSHAGVVLKARGEGDSTFSVFQRASDAVAAALELQEALLAAPWPADAQISVRAAVHSGEALERDGDYYGRTVNRASRAFAVQPRPTRSSSSASSAQLVIDQLPAGARLVEVGPQPLRDLERPETLYVVESTTLDAPSTCVAASADGEFGCKTFGDGHVSVHRDRGLALALGITSGRDASGVGSSRRVDPRCGGCVVRCCVRAGR